MNRTRARELYEKYGFLIYGRCLGILGNQEDAKDAMHDIFLKVLDKIDTVRDARKIVPWIYAAATNHCFNLLRMQKKFVDQAADETAADPRNEDACIEQRDLIRRIMAFHNAKVRDAVYYTFVEKLNQEEIREVTGQSPATIRRNLKKFRDSLPALAKRLDDA
jgi:RNA polymerase sigma-70 factor (ECF subfamily)